MTATRRQFLSSAAALIASRTPPNILLLFPDQHRFDWIGTNPSLPVRTPNLDALARRGARFTRAITPSPLCAPARACLAAGLEYHRCRVPSNAYDYPLEQTTHYTFLRDRGYHVTGCGKFDLHKKTLDWGLDGRRLLREWGCSDGIDNAGKLDAIRSGAVTPKDPYMAYLHQRGLAAVHVADFAKRKNYSATFPTPLPEEAYCDNWVGANAVTLLHRVPAGKPWYLTVNFTGPHNPMDITRRMEERWRNVTGFPQPNRCRDFTPETHVAIRQNYSAMVENIDRWAGLLINEIRRRGELDNTLIVWSSDHGEMLGDHSRWGKSAPFQPSIGVPLVVAGPGVKPGLVSDTLVSVMDLAATFLDYAGLPRPAAMDSRSLRPMLEGRSRSHRDHVFSGLGDWRVVFDGRYKLIRGFPTSPLLFDLDANPLENSNIAGQAPNIVARLSRLLEPGTDGTFPNNLREEVNIL